MAMVTLLTSGCANNISQPLSFDNNHHLRDASFSSYLNRSKETFVHKLAAESSAYPNSNSIITTPPHEHLYLGRKKVEDGEIGVFGAEKYFNGGMDDEEEDSRVAANNGAINYQYAKDEPVDIISPMKPKPKTKTQPQPQPQSGTPSIHSESSWNSQSALLQSVLRNPPQRKTSKRYGKGILASLGCNCYCNDKNSVDIDEHKGTVNQGKSVMKEPIQNGPDTVDLARANKSRLNPLVMEEMHCKKINEVGLGLNREDCFSFPILNSKPANPETEVHLQEREDDKQRKSLEVFGTTKKKKSFSLERRLTMLTWDTNSRGEEFEIPASYDNESDASSDLFEIESFTNNGNSFLLRQSSDGMSSCVTPTTCYAPSEASIEWSVVTASAADFSVMSDSEDIINSATTKKAQKMSSNVKAASGKEIERRRSGILLGCKSQKAVRVAGDAYRSNGKAVPPDPRRNHHRPDSFAPVTRFQAENRLTGFDSRNHGFGACSLSRPHSSRSSHLLYIQ